MRSDSKTDDLNLALDTLLAMEDWLTAEERIFRSAYKGDAAKTATLAHGVFLEAMVKAKPLIEKRRLSRNG